MVELKDKPHVLLFLLLWFFQCFVRRCSVFEQGAQMEHTCWWCSGPECQSSARGAWAHPGLCGHLMVVLGREPVTEQGTPTLCPPFLCPPICGGASTPTSAQQQQLSSGWRKRGATQGPAWGPPIHSGGACWAHGQSVLLKQVSPASHSQRQEVAS